MFSLLKGVWSERCPLIICWEFCQSVLKDYVMYCISMFEEWACVALELLDTVKKYGKIKLSWMAYSGQQRHRGRTLSLLLFWQGQIHADKDFSRRFQTDLKRFDLEGYKRKRDIKIWFQVKKLCQLHNRKIFLFEFILPVASICLVNTRLKKVMVY